MASNLPSGTPGTLYAAQQPAGVWARPTSTWLILIGVWLAYKPGQPRDPHQPHFVLVVSADVRNRTRDHVMVVPIFSRGNLGLTRLVIPAEGTGLRYDSVLFCEELMTIDKELLEEGPHGRASPALLDAVVIEVRRALGDFSA